MEQDVWYFGREAAYYAEEQGGVLIEDLYDICRGSKAVQVGPEEKSPGS